MRVLGPGIMPSSSRRPGADPGGLPSRVAAIVAAEGISGPGRQLAGLACELGRADIELRVLLLWRTGGPRPAFATLLDRLGVHYEIVQDRGPLDRTIVRRVRDILETWSPDVLQTHGYKATAIAWALRRARPNWPWIGFFHGSTSESARAHLYHWLDRRMLGAADRVVVMSRRQQVELAARGTRAQLIHNAVVPLVGPPAAESDSERIAVLLDSMPRPRIGVIGRLSPEKGIDVFLRALAELKSRGRAPSAVLAGDGPARASLESLRDMLGLRDSVFFAGNVQATDAVYAAIDLLVIPSRSEGLPNVLLEAIAADVPVVATDVGEMREVLADAAAGSLVPPADPIALADAIVSVLAEPDARRASAARSRAADRFSIERRVLAHLDLYREVIALRRRGMT